MRTAALSLLVILASPAMADDFRNAAFGMSRADVRATEPGVQWREGDDVIGFSTAIAGLDAVAQYEFTNDRLYAGGYRIIEQHSNRTLYVSDYETLFGLLGEKYGKPKDDRTVWRNDLYRDDPEDYGIAVALGHLAKMATWETPTAEINLLLTGDNYKIDLYVYYKSRELGAEAEADDHQEALNDL